MATLKVISSMASREVLKELAMRFQKRHGHNVELEAIGGVEAAKRVRADEAFDAVVLARNAIDALAGEAKVLKDSIKDIARSGISVAVRQGASRPDISTEEAVRKAVMAAPTLSYSTGPSGVYLEKKFAAWGELETLRSRIVVPPPGTPVASLVAAGKAALGFQQLSELINVPGIDVLGALPSGMQLMTTFSGATATTSKQPQLVQSLLDFMASAETAEVKVTFGMEACH
jgi:molybdate transport system substrate-binding protein